MPLNQQPKLQWSVPFPNGPATISVTMRTITPNADLMEEIVVITKWRAKKMPMLEMKLSQSGEFSLSSTAMLANAWNTQSIPPKNQLLMEQTVLPHSGLEMPFVMTKTTPKSVDLMVEIVVTTKDKDGTTIVLIVNVLHKFYVKNVFIHFLIFRNKS